VSIFAGPVGYLPVLAALGFLIFHEFRAELRPEGPTRHRYPRAVLTAISIALSALFLRFLDFHI
jgi:hypothetical protein